MEIKLLLIVVLLAAVSILLVLFSGLVPPEYAFSYKTILGLNFFSIILYIFAFIMFLIRFNSYQKRIYEHTTNVNDLLAMIVVSEDITVREIETTPQTETPA